jgi:hypothetical protein
MIAERSKHPSQPNAYSSRDLAAVGFPRGVVAMFGDVLGWVGDLVSSLFSISGLVIVLLALLLTAILVRA